MISPCELSEKEYLDTMQGRMKNITDSADCLVDIWGYASNFGIRTQLSEYGFENQLVESVYENEEGTYQHILLFGTSENVFVVIVVDVQKREIFGHYYLDLNEKYGLDEI